MAASHSLRTLLSLSAAERSALRRVGIATTEQLLGAAETRAAERALAKKAGIQEAAVREAVNRADLLRVGLGAVRADLFEAAGVNSAAELARRDAHSLWQALNRYAESHRSKDLRLPSEKTLADYIARAQALQAPPAPSGPIDEARARALAGAELDRYIDQVLFSADPAGKTFRDAILAWRPSTEWPTVQQHMHDDAATFIAKAQLSTDPAVPGSFWLSGDLIGLYSEVKLDSTGKVLDTLVEID